MRFFNGQRSGLGILGGLGVALLIIFGSERHGEALPPGADTCPGGFPAHCVRCLNNDCVRACFGDVTREINDEGQRFIVEVCD